MQSGTKDGIRTAVIPATFRGGITGDFLGWVGATSAEYMNLITFWMQISGVVCPSISRREIFQGIRLIANAMIVLAENRQSEFSVWANSRKPGVYKVDLA